MFIVKVTLNGNNVGIGPRAYSNVDAASADAEARNTKAREMGLKTSYAPSAASDPGEIRRNILGENAVVFDKFAGGL